MVKYILKFFVAVSSVFWGSNAVANVDWNWSFQDRSIDLAKQEVAWVTVTNNAVSTEELHVEGISPFSFGYLGLLYEDDFKRVITPTLFAAHQTLLPGESISFVAIQFYLNPVDLPTPGVAYQILPTLTVVAGPSCGHDVSRPGCIGLSQPADTSFTITYAPVPELPSNALMFVGLLICAFATKVTQEPARRY